LLAGLAAALPRADALLMSGSLAGGAAGPVDFYARAAALAVAAREGGVPCILDCCGPALRAALAYRPAIIKPNRDELAKTIGADLHDDQRLCAAIAGLLIGPQHAGAIVVTMGSSGAIAASSEGWWRIVPPRIQPVSPIGSGDAFAAGLAAGTVERRTLAEAARYATALAAANALTPRPGWINLADVGPLERATTVSALER
jgi:fructose-1-phosphate kinase PfkB-like protein